MGSGDGQNAVSTCARQDECMDLSFSIGAADKCSSADCEWTVCLKLDLNSEQCGNDGTVSHSCVADENDCNPSVDGINKDDFSEVSGLEDGHEQCQTGTPGSTLHFILKDGVGCGDNTLSWTHENSAQIGCRRLSDYEMTGSCTGNGNRDKECIWSVTLPECTSEYTPAPSGVSEDEDEPETVTEQENEPETGTVTEQETETVTEQEDEPETVSEQEDEQEPPTQKDTPEEEDEPEEEEEEPEEEDSPPSEIADPNCKRRDFKQCDDTCHVTFPPLLVDCHVVLFACSIKVGFARDMAAN